MRIVYIHNTQKCQIAHKRQIDKYPLNPLRPFGCSCSCSFLYPGLQSSFFCFSEQIYGQISIYLFIATLSFALLDRGLIRCSSADGTTTFLLYNSKGRSMFPKWSLMTSPATLPVLKGFYQSVFERMVGNHANRPPGLSKSLPSVKIDQRIHFIVDFDAQRLVHLGKIFCAGPIAHCCKMALRSLVVSIFSTSSLLQSFFARVMAFRTSP